MKKTNNTFELIYGMYARHHGITTDYTQCSYAHKCGVLKDIANVLNGDWKPDVDDTSQDKACLIANLQTNGVEVLALDGWNVDQCVVFSPEAAEQAKDIVPFDFLKSFWG